MASSMTQIWDDKQGKYVDYDMGKGFEKIAVPATPSTSSTMADDAKKMDEIYKPIAAAALASNTTDKDYKPYSGMTPAEQAQALSAALANNKIVEASALAWNASRYPGEVLTGPSAATIWNPDTGTKVAVRLDQKTGKVVEEDLLKLPDDMNLIKGGKWKLWTGGMASGIEARAAITNTPVPQANTVKQAVVTPPSTVAKTPVVTTSAPIVIKTGSIYVDNIKELPKLVGMTQKDSTGKIWLDPSRAQYIGTMAEVAKIPENKRVLLNGKYYKIL
jgi:hypothetical protein